MNVATFFNYAGNPGTLPNATYLAALPANVVVFTLGFNDAGSSAAVAQVNALSAFKSARAIWPNAVIVVFSSQPGTHNGSGASVDTGILAAFNQFNDANSFYFPVWLDPAGAWVSGTGYALTGHTTGTGNSDFYSGTDGTHPTMSGQEYISQRMARQIDYALTSVGL
jgi:lysophospholipase L1-like esterase